MSVKADKVKVGAEVKWYDLQGPHQVTVTARETVTYDPNIKYSKITDENGNTYLLDVARTLEVVDESD